MATIPRDHFAKHKSGLIDEGVCAALFTAADEYQRQRTAAYLKETLVELQRRGRSVDWCIHRRKEQQDTAAGVVAIVAVVGLVALVAAGGGGGGGTPQTDFSATDRDWDWDWDQFYDENYQLVWVCRGVQSGRFSTTGRCDYKAKVDLRWPGTRFTR